MYEVGSSKQCRRPSFQAVLARERRFGLVAGVDCTGSPGSIHADHPRLPQGQPSRGGGFAEGGKEVSEEDIEREKERE